jgi:hypothetical protein
MNWIDRSKSWIDRQAHQTSTKIGGTLATFVLFWPFIAPSIPRLLDSLDDTHPLLETIMRIVVGLLGLVCVVYNEDANKQNPQ